MIFVTKTRPEGGATGRVAVHGCGGQGVLTVRHLLAQTFYESGRYVQTFVTYGGERLGTPVTAFVRVPNQPIRLRCDMENPHAVLVFQDTIY